MKDLPSLLKPLCFFICVFFLLSTKHGGYLSLSAGNHNFCLCSSHRIPLLIFITFTDGTFSCVAEFLLKKKRIFLHIPDVSLCHALDS